MNIESKSQLYSSYIIIIILIFLFMNFFLYSQYVSEFSIFPISIFSLKKSERYLNDDDDDDELFLAEKLNQNFKFVQTIHENDTLHEFRFIHEQIMRGKLPLKVSVNGHTYAGYANRLYSMLSSLVIALVTDSAFIVRWERINNHIREPFLKTFHDFSSEKNEFNINYNPGNVIHPIGSFGWKMTKNMDNLIKTSLPKYKNRFLYRIPEAYFFELCSNPDYYNKFYYYGLVSRETILKAHEITYNMKYGLLNYTSEYKQDIILQVPFEVGGNLLNKCGYQKIT